MNQDEPPPRRFRTGASVLAIAILLGGCGPRLDRDELGEVIFTLPKVPGTDEPYEMPAPYFVPQGAAGPRPDAPAGAFGGDAGEDAATDAP